MPGGDRTGPMGAGPMTGRGAGYCRDAAVPGFMNRMIGGFFGRGGRGGGGGRGRRNMFHATGLTGWQRAAGTMGGVGPTAAGAPATLSPEEEIQILRQRADAATATLEQVRQRIDELSGTASRTTG